MCVGEANPSDIRMLVPTDRDVMQIDQILYCMYASQSNYSFTYTIYTHKTCYETYCMTKHKNKLVDFCDKSRKRDKGNIR